MEPVERKDILPSVTPRRKTGCGWMYVTVTFQDGQPFEVFIQLGKAGGCAAANHEFVARVISKAMRAGINADVIVQEGLGIGCHKHELIHAKEMSCPHAIADAIKEATQSFVDLGITDKGENIADQKESNGSEKGKEKNTSETVAEEINNVELEYEFRNPKEEPDMETS